MSFADKDCAGYDPFHCTQPCQRALLKLKGGDVVIQGEIVEAKRLPESNSTQFPVYRIGIREGERLSGHHDVGLLPRNGQGDLQIDWGFMSIDGFLERFKVVSRHAHQIFSRF